MLTIHKIGFYGKLFRKLLKTFTDSPVTNSINKTKPGSNRPGKFGYNLDRILSKYVIRAFRVDSGQHFSYTCSIRILSNLGDIIEKLMLPFRRSVQWLHLRALIQFRITSTASHCNDARGLLLIIPIFTLSTNPHNLLSFFTSPIC